MNGKGMTIAGFAALIAALALNGKAALEALAGLPIVLTSFATGLPFGVVSFAAALAMGCLTWIHARTRLTMGKGGRQGRDFRASNLALLAAIATTMAQTVVMRGSQSSALLMAIMLGILAGLLAPLLTQGVLSFIRRGETPEDER